jgi:hypothetical protein
LKREQPLAFGSLESCGSLELHELLELLEVAPAAESLESRGIVESARLITIESLDSLASNRRFRCEIESDRAITLESFVKRAFFSRGRGTDIAHQSAQRFVDVIPARWSTSLAIAK